MSKIQKIGAKSAKNYYYEKDPIFNADGDGENLSWFGVGAEALGLEGKIDQKEFSNILDGKSPDGLVQLRDTSHTTGGDVSAYDLVLSAPKSVSLLAISGEDKAVEAAHDKAVEATLKFVEENYANTQKTRTDENGVKYKEHVNNGNLTIAVAKHSVSRPDKNGAVDPHLHSHAVIMNQVFDKETNAYRALSVKEMMSKNKMIEDHYKSELAKNLVSAGYTIETKSHGFDIKMDQAIIDNFSSRRNEIEAKAAELGAVSAKDKKIIQHGYKQEKGNYTKEELKQIWNDKLSDFKKSFNDLKEEAKTNENEYSLSKKEVLEKTFELMSQTNAIVKEDKLLRAAAHVSLGNFTLKELKDELNSVKKIGQQADSDLKFLGKNEKGDKVFTNKAMHDLERENREAIKNQEKQTAIMSKEKFEKGLKDFEDKNFKLNDGQRESARAILTGDDKFLAIQGVAGAGKTTMLKAVNHILDHNKINLEVTLLAPTNKAAQGAIAESKLENGKTFKGSTLAKHILNNESVENRDKEISESAKKHNQNDIKVDTKLDKQLELKDKSENNLAKSGFTLKKSSQAEIFIKSGAKAFSEKNGQSLISIQKTKDGIQSSSKHKNGRSSIVRGGEFDGAKKVEKWDVKKGTYESTMTFKDGSKFNTKMKSAGQDNTLSKLIHSSQSVEKSNHNGDIQSQKSTTLLGMTYATKDAKTAWGEQSKKSFDILKLAAIEKNVVKTKLGSEESTKKSLFGFSKTDKLDTAFDGKGQIAHQEKITSLSFAGITFHQKIEVSDIKNNNAHLKINEKVNNEKTYQKEAVVDKDLAKSIVNKSADNIKSNTSEKQKLFIIDETSMTSQQDFKDFRNTLSKDTKVVMMGDTQQLKSVGAGDVFKDIQDHTKTVHMNESQRQLNTQEKDVAANVRSSSTINKTMDALEKNQKIHEFGSREEMIEKAADSAVRKDVVSGEQFGKKLEKEVDYKNNLTLASTNETVKELNSKIRDKLHETGQINKNDHVKADVKITKNMTASKQMIADNFEKGQNVKTFKNVSGMVKGKEYKIIDIDKTNNKLTLKTQTNSGADAYAKIDLKDAAGKLQVSQDEKREFSKGDIVVVTGTDKKADLLNSDRGIVTNIDSKNQKITVDFGDRGTKEIDLSKGDKSIDHGYAMTTHKSQGMSVDRVQAVADTKNESITSNAFHVQLTRQKFSSEVFTTDKEKLINSTKKEDVKDTTLDYNKVDVKDTKSDNKDEVKSDVKSSSEDVKDTKSDNKDEVKSDVKSSSEEKQTDTKSENKDNTSSDNTKSFSDQKIDPSSLKQEDMRIDLNEAKIDKQDITTKKEENLSEKAKDIDINKANTQEAAQKQTTSIER